MSEKRAHAEINLSKLKSNLNIIKGYINGNAKIGAVVKADAYGHGAVAVVKELIKDEYIQMIIVSKKEEAFEIEAEYFNIPILILENIIGDDEDYLLHKNFIFSAYNMEFLCYAECLAKKYKKKIRIHIRIDISDSGMGFGIDYFKKCYKKIFNMKYIVVEGIYTHLYSAYSFRRDVILKELNLFSEIIISLPEKIRKRLTIHAAGSALFFEYPEYHFDMVRIGTALYGLPCHPVYKYGLQMILTLKARVISIKSIPGNINISYLKKRGNEWNKVINNKNVNIVRISYGYWDSPLLMTHNNIHVVINEKLYPLVDEACMDYACVHISENKDIQIDDEVIILGENPGVTIYDILKRTDVELVHSEWFCIMSKRLPKIYIND